jgi:hypothetical protein
MSGWVLDASIALSWLLADEADASALLVLGLVLPPACPSLKSR